MKTIEFSKQVYSLNSVRSVAGVYQNHAKIIIEEDIDKIRVFFEKCRFSEERTVKEFENYLIGIENSNGNN